MGGSEPIAAGNLCRKDVDAISGANGDEAWANPKACPRDATGTEDNSPKKEKLNTGFDGVDGMALAQDRGLHEWETLSIRMVLIDKIHTYL